MKSETDNKSPPLCSRCKTEPAKVHIPDTPRCEDCFKFYLDRTFKTTIGRMQAGGQRTMGVAISGGKCSTAAAFLLSKYHQSLNPNPKIPSSRIVLIHIKLPTIVNSIERHQIEVEEKEEEKETPQIIYTIQEKISNSELVIKQLDSQAYKNILNIHDISDRLYFLKNHISQLLASVSKDCNVDTLILGSSVNRIAIDILSSIISSRGTQVMNDATNQQVINDIRFIKPLVGIPIRLLVRYAIMQLPDADFIQNSENHPSNHRHCSLQSVVTDFISQANQDNPSSVHNVVNVACRLQQNEGKSCSLCGYVIVDMLNNSDANRCNENAQECDDCECDEGKRIVKKLCHGCNESVNRANSLKAGSNEPNSVITLMKRESMRKEIEEFLL